MCRLADFIEKEEGKGVCSTILKKQALNSGLLNINEKERPEPEASDVLWDCSSGRKRRA